MNVLKRKAKEKGRRGSPRFLFYKELGSISVYFTSPPNPRAIKATGKLTSFKVWWEATKTHAAKLARPRYVFSIPQCFLWKEKGVNGTESPKMLGAEKKNKKKSKTRQDFCLSLRKMDQICSFVPYF